MLNRASLLLMLALAACDSPGLPSDPGTPDASTDGAQPDIACPELQVFDVASHQCVDAPVLDIIACPLYAPNCTLQFHRVAPGDHTKQSVTLLNTGEGPLHIQSVTLSGGGPFIIAQGLPVTLAPREDFSLDVTFAPTQDGFYTGTLTVQSDAAVTIPNAVPVRAASLAAACSDTDGCLIGEICNASVCDTCPTITPPQCQNGRVVLSGDPGTCQQPMCQCTPPAVYDMHIGSCVPPA